MHLFKRVYTTTVLIFLVTRRQYNERQRVVNVKVSLGINNLYLHFYYGLPLDIYLYPSLNIDGI